MCGRTIDVARLGDALLFATAKGPAIWTCWSGSSLVDEHTIAFLAVTDLEKFLADWAILLAGFWHTLFLGGVVDLSPATCRLRGFRPNTVAA